MGQETDVNKAEEDNTFARNDARKFSNILSANSLVDLKNYDVDSDNFFSKIDNCFSEQESVSMKFEHEDNQLN